MARSKAQSVDIGSGAISPEFAEQIRENLSPQSVAAIASHLQAAAGAFGSADWSPEYLQAMQGVHWLARTLIEDVLGVAAFNDLVEEIGL